MAETFNYVDTLPHCTTPTAMPASPSQSAPPLEGVGVGLVQVLVWSATPSPQVVEHSSTSTQADHPRSTAAGAATTLPSHLQMAQPLSEAPSPLKSESMRM